MDNNIILDDNLTTDNLSDFFKSNLLEAAKWAKFIAIVGFVVIGLMVLAGFGFIFAGSSLMHYAGLGGGFFGSLLSLFYIAITLLYFLPCLYLYKFGNNVQKGIYNSQNTLDTGIQNLKRFFKFVGFFTIIILALYALMLIASVFFIF